MVQWTFIHHGYKTVQPAKLFEPDSSGYPVYDTEYVGQRRGVQRAGKDAYDHGTYGDRCDRYHTFDAHIPFLSIFFCKRDYGRGGKGVRTDDYVKEKRG